MSLDTELQKLNQRLALIEERLAKLESPTSQATGAKQEVVEKQKKLSIKEFLLSKKPTSDVQKTLAIAYYLEKLEGIDSFNASDLLKAFERAREQKPTNINDKVNKNIQNGHMDIASTKKESKKAWHLTNSGEEFVESSFKVVE